MNRYFVVGAISAIFAQPAAAITFPSLTTIYVGAGVYETGGSNGAITLFRCANVSGQSASLRFLVLDAVGSIAGTPRDTTIAHGASAMAGTGNAIQVEGEFSMATGVLEAGAVVNIESTQSGVFCNAVIFDPDSLIREGSPLPLVRVNPHPGTAE
jgi:hypothetical protein